MAYSTPLTAVSNSALTAAQWNASVRDNMLVTPAALATTAGSHFAATGTNAIAERIAADATVPTGEATSTTTYTNLTTSGPAVTVTTGTSALIGTYGKQGNSTASANTWISFSVSGATTIASTDAYALSYDSPVAGSGVFHGTVTRLSSLTSGSNTFTMQYRVTSGAGTFSNRRIWVLPF
jgi:hypothetical protein